MINDSVNYTDIWKGRPNGITLIPPNNWSPEAAKLARSWLNSCLDLHDSCAITHSHGGMKHVPTRLIRVENDTAHGMRAKLVLGANAPPGVQYLTLSHCWGNQPDFLTLKMDNYDSFLQQIPIFDPKFNQTFRDAFGVTLDLGHGYIWIDSLCIIQDTPGAADWNKECPQVGYIYAGGVCNISVTDFANGAAGMFTKRNVGLLAPCPIQVPRLSPRYIAANTKPFDYPETEHPLLSRGWVLQEHALVSVDSVFQKIDQ